MDDLRTILLLIGVVVVLGVYAWSRLQQRTPGSATPKVTVRTERDDAADLDSKDLENELAHMEQLLSNREQDPVQVDSEHLIIISVVAPEGDSFAGPALLKALENNRLVYGDERVYCRELKGGTEPVFRVANLVKPGTFDPAQMDDFISPGIVFILQLPGPRDGAEAFDDMVKTAERMAVELGGELRDQQHGVLSHQAIMQQREQIFASRMAY